MGFRAPRVCPCASHGLSPAVVLPLWPSPRGLWDRRPCVSFWGPGRSASGPPPPDLPSGQPGASPLPPGSLLQALMLLGGRGWSAENPSFAFFSVGSPWRSPCFSGSGCLRNSRACVSFEVARSPRSRRVCSYGTVPPTGHSPNSPVQTPEGDGSSKNVSPDDVSSVYH